MRIVIDTNIIASAIFFGGRPGELLKMLIAHKIDAFASPDIITEYQETVEELCNKYPSKPPRLPLATIIAAINLLEPSTSVQICRDPDDNKFIECALDADCLYIVSGDKDLLSLKQYEGIQIVTIADFFTHHLPS